MSGAEHIYFYSQRTEDGRIAIGGRGKPYSWGSQLDDNGRLNQGTQDQLQGILRNLFPDAAFEFEHAWCGVLGVTRDWSPFVSVDRQSKVIQAGGYAGQGVTAAYVAAKTVADFVLERDTELTNSVWVRNRPRKWEPEPLRWLGANAVQKLYQTADQIEKRRGGPKTSKVAEFAHRVAGRV
jgi:glycine/D-amino acid oxidase-like deaminating enzyme